MVLSKRFRIAVFSGLLLTVLSVWNPEMGRRAVATSGYALREMLSILPPIFILLGLLDVWVPRETMVRLMGHRSGALGAMLAFFLGSAAAGPLYGAFPVAAVFMKKGASFINVMIFIGAWSTTKIPMFLFELSALGAPFALTRLLVNIPGIMLMAWLLKAMTPEEALTELYARMERIG